MVDAFKVARKRLKYLKKQTKSEFILLTCDDYDRLSYVAHSPDAIELATICMEALAIKKTIKRRRK